MNTDLSETNPFSIIRAIGDDAWLVDKDSDTFSYGTLIPVARNNEVVWLMEAKAVFGAILCIE